MTSILEFYRLFIFSGTIKSLFCFSKILIGNRRVKIHLSKEGLIICDYLYNYLKILNDSVIRLSGSKVHISYFMNITYKYWVKVHIFTISLQELHYLQELYYYLSFDRFTWNSKHINNHKLFQ